MAELLGYNDGENTKTPAEALESVELGVGDARRAVEGRTVFGVGEASAVYRAREAGVGMAANSETMEAGKALPATRGCC